MKNFAKSVTVNNSATISACSDESGVSVFKLEESDWISSYRIPIKNPETVVMNGAGDILAVSFDTNSVAVFREDSGIWNMIGQVMTGDHKLDEFGRSIDMNESGETIVIGAPMGGYDFSSSDPEFRIPLYYDDRVGDYQEKINDYEYLESSGEIFQESAGFVEVYEFNNSLNVWQRVGQRIEGKQKNSKLGRSVSINDEGSRIVSLGSSKLGLISEVTLCDFNGSQWVNSLGGLNLEVQAWDMVNSKSSVSISGDGLTFAFGNYEPSRNNVKVFRLNKMFNRWQQIGGAILDNRPTRNSKFGANLSLDHSGASLLISNGNTGEVFIYKYLGKWVQSGFANSGGFTFGANSSITSDGLNFISSKVGDLARCYEAGSEVAYISTAMTEKGLDFGDPEWYKNEAYAMNQFPEAGDHSFEDFDSLNLTFNNKPLYATYPGIDSDNGFLKNWRPKQEVYDLYSEQKINSSKLHGNYNFINNLNINDFLPVQNEFGDFLDFGKHYNPGMPHYDLINGKELGQDYRYFGNLTSEGFWRQFKDIAASIESMGGGAITLGFMMSGFFPDSGLVNFLDKKDSNLREIMELGGEQAVGVCDIMMQNYSRCGKGLYMGINGDGNVIRRKLWSIMFKESDGYPWVHQFIEWGLYMSSSNSVSDTNTLLKNWTSPIPGEKITNVIPSSVADGNIKGQVFNPPFMRKLYAFDSTFSYRGEEYTVYDNFPFMDFNMTPIRWNEK